MAVEFELSSPTPARYLVRLSVDSGGKIQEANDDEQTVTVDVVVPDPGGTILEPVPAAGARNVSLNTAIELSFDDVMYLGTLVVPATGVSSSVHVGRAPDPAADPIPTSIQGRLMAIYGAVPALLMGLGALFLRRFPITRERHAEVRAALDDRHAA